MICLERGTRSESVSPKIDSAWRWRIPPWNEFLLIFHNLWKSSLTIFHKLTLYAHTIDLRYCRARTYFTAMYVHTVYHIILNSAAARSNFALKQISNSSNLLQIIFFCISPESRLISGGRLFCSLDSLRFFTISQNKWVSKGTITWDGFFENLFLLGFKTVFIGRIRRERNVH